MFQLPWHKHFQFQRFGWPVFSCYTFYLAPLTTFSVSISSWVSTRWYICIQAKRTVYKTVSWSLAGNSMHCTAGHKRLSYSFDYYSWNYHTVPHYCWSNGGIDPFWTRKKHSKRFNNYITQVLKYAKKNGFTASK